MSSFSIQCICGERFHVDDSAIGRRLLCRRCDRIVDVRRPPAPAKPIPLTPIPKAASARPTPARPTPATPASRQSAPNTTRSGAGGVRDFTDALGTWAAALRHAVRRRDGSRDGRRANSQQHAGLLVSLEVASWAYVIVTALVALVMWEYGDQWWPATLLLFMGRWVFLLPLAVLIFTAVAVRHVRLALPIAVATLVVVFPIMGGRLPWRRLLPTPEGIPLRVVTFNADGGRSVAPQLPYLLEEWNADVVLLQECGEALTDATEQVPGWNWHHVHGLCMLTRLPIVAAEQMDRTTLERIKQSGATSIGGAGYVVRYTLTATGRTINVTNLHLETPRKGLEGLAAGTRDPTALANAGNLQRLALNTELRSIESKLARRWVDGGHFPAVVAGDFNTPVESQIFQEHWDGLADAFSTVGSGFGMTKFNGWIRIRIDHILTDDAWRPLRVHRGRDAGSDHLPLIADLVLTRP